MTADRAAYGRRQAELLRALAGADLPEGFDAADAAATSAALVDKRRRAVAKALPALALEPGFAERFERFARTTPATPHDGAAFARTLDRRTLSEDAWVELLLSGLGRRLGGAVRLREPRGLLLAVRLPRRRVISLRLGGSERR